MSRDSEVTWPPPVRDALRSGFSQCLPVFVLWGPEQRLFYNELGDSIFELAQIKPALGSPLQIVWPALHTELSETCKRVKDSGIAAHQHFVGVVPGVRAAKQRYFTFVCTPIKDNAAHVVGLHCTALQMAADGTEAEHVRALVPAIEDPSPLPYQRLVNKLPQLMWTARHDGSIEYANERWMEYTGMTLHETLGTGWTHALHAEDLKNTAGAWSDALTHAVPIDVEYRLRRYDGVYRWHLARAVPLSAPNGGPPYWVGTLTDIDDQKRAFERVAQAEEQLRGQMEQLRVAEARLRLATTACRVGVWEIDTETGTLWRSGAHDALYGYEHPVEHWTLATTLQHVHVDDVESVAATLKKGIDDRASFDSTFRVVWPDKSVHWMAARGEVYIGSSGHGKVLGVLRDITQSRVAEEALRRAIAVREEFLSIASHELKTPVTSLKLQLQMAARQIKPASATAGGNDRLLRYITVSVNQVDRLTRLIADLLDVAKIQAGKVEYHFEDFDMRELIYEVVERLAGQLELAHCGLTVRIDKPILGHWDRSRIEQVLINLVSNAVKYAPGKPIQVSASGSNQHVTIAVRDYGPGIAVDGQERIFKRFERAVSARNISGLGLGLFIAKEIVSNHGGAIHVESVPGAGATFIIDLPSQTPAV